jgi:hypothetical protein
LSSFFVISSLLGFNLRCKWLTRCPDLIPVKFAVLVGIEAGKEIVYFSLLAQHLTGACENIEGELLEFVKDKHTIFVFVSNIEHLPDHGFEIRGAHARLSRPSKLFGLNFALNRFNSCPDLAPVELSIFVSIEPREQLVNIFLEFCNLKFTDSS